MAPLGLHVSLSQTARHTCILLPLCSSQQANEVYMLPVQSPVRQLPCVNLRTCVLAPQIMNPVVCDSMCTCVLLQDCMYPYMR